MGAGRTGQSTYRLPIEHAMIPINTIFDLLTIEANIFTNTFISPRKRRCNLVVWSVAGQPFDFCSHLVIITTTFLIFIVIACAQSTSATSINAITSVKLWLCMTPAVNKRRSVNNKCVSARDAEMTESLLHLDVARLLHYHPISALSEMHSHSCRLVVLCIPAHRTVERRDQNVIRSRNGVPNP